MKFFHLSDLHIGKIVNGFSMLNEQKHFFKQIINYIDAEKPQAVLIAGDVYDRQIPGVEAVQAFDDFITELAKTGTAILLISGNHDSPQRLDFASRLLQNHNIYFYGSFDGKMQKVVLNDEIGKVNFYLLPFVKPAMVRNILNSDTNEENSNIEEYDEMISIIIKNASVNYGERNVLVSHQFYTKPNLNLERSDSESSPIGGLDSVNAGFIEKFDYAALGHLHRSQSAGQDNIRYCGSPVKYSFSEWRHDKSILMVDLGKKIKDNKSAEIKITHLPITAIHDMREIKGEIDILLSDKITRQAKKEGYIEDYIRVILTDEKEIIDPMGKLRSMYPNIMELKIENSKTNINLNEIGQDIESIENISPFELFCNFFKEVTGSVLNEAQEKIAQELFESDAEGELFA